MSLSLKDNLILSVLNWDKEAFANKFLQERFPQYFDISEYKHKFIEFKREITSQVWTNKGCINIIVTDKIPFRYVKDVDVNKIRKDGFVYYSINNEYFRSIKFVIAVDISLSNMLDHIADYRTWDDKFTQFFLYGIELNSFHSKILFDQGYIYLPLHFNP